MCSKRHVENDVGIAVKEKLRERSLYYIDIVAYILLDFTIIDMCETTLDDEDFNDESSPETITQVYKNLLQYKLDLKYFNDKENPQYEKDVEINKTDIIQQYNFDEEIKGKFIATYKKGLNKMYLEYVIESCKNEYDRYTGYTETESNTKMCELIKKNMKRYKLDLKYYFDQKNPLYVQMGKEK